MNTLQFFRNPNLPENLDWHTRNEHKPKPKPRRDKRCLPQSTKDDVPVQDPLAPHDDGQIEDDIVIVETVSLQDVSIPEVDENITEVEEDVTEIDENIPILPPPAGLENLPTLCENLPMIQDVKTLTKPAKAKRKINRPNPYKKKSLFFWRSGHNRISKIAEREHDYSHPADINEMKVKFEYIRDLLAETSASEKRLMKELKAEKKRAKQLEQNLEKVRQRLETKELELSRFFTRELQNCVYEPQIPVNMQENKYLKPTNIVAVDVNNLEMVENVENFDPMQNVLPGQEHQCHMCNERFSTLEVFKAHLFSAHNVKDDEVLSQEYKCDICKEEFDNLNKFLIHITKTHEKDNNKCEYCGLNFEDYGDLEKHLKEICGRFFACGSCDKKFYDQDKLQSHFENIHAEKTHICEYCDKAFGRYQSMILHKQTVHIDERERNFICDICGKGYIMQSNLTVHKRIHSPNYKGTVEQKEFLCSHCPKIFSRKHYLDRHIQALHSDNKRYKCKEKDCDYQTMKKETLEKHVKRVHEGDENFGKFFCESCGKSFESAQMIKDHKATIHDGLKNHKCEKCDKKFGYYHALRNHISEVHRGKPKKSRNKPKADSTSSSKLPKGSLDYVGTKMGDDWSCNGCQKVFKGPNKGKFYT